MTGQHQQPGSDQVLTPLPDAGEPATGDHTSTFGADVVAALCNSSKMIDQRFQFGPVRHEQRFTVKFTGQLLVFGRHASVLRLGLTTTPGALPAELGAVPWTRGNRGPCSSVRAACSAFKPPPANTNNTTPDHQDPRRQEPLAECSQRGVSAKGGPAPARACAGGFEPVGPSRVRPRMARWGRETSLICDSRLQVSLRLRRANHSLFGFD
jgi:hypothetical protein